MKYLTLTLVLLLSSTLAQAQSLGVTLSWTDQANNEDGFHIYRRAESDPSPALLQEIPTADTETFDDTVPDGTQRWCYTVTAYNTAGESDSSNEACSKTFAELPPNAPTGLTVQKMTITQSQSVVIQP